MNSDVDSRIDTIVNCLAQVLKTAITHQDTAEESVKRLENTSINLNQEIKELKDQIRKEIKSSVKQEIEATLKKSSDEVFEELLKNFEAANTSALQAANTFQSATEHCQKTMSWSTWGVCALAASFSAVISIIAVSLFRPSSSVNSKMIDALSTSQITECKYRNEKRLCAKVDEKINLKSGYRVVLLKSKQ